MAGRRFVPRLREWAAVVVVAVILIASVPTTSASRFPHGPVAPRPHSLRLEASVRSPSASMPLPVTPHPSGQLHNALVVAPCDTPTAWNVEVEQATDPSNGYLYEAWIGCGGIGFSRSVDGGYSFEAAFSVPGSTTGAAGPTNSSWDPAVAVAPNGTVYVAYMVNRTQGDAPVVARSFDHGRSFAGFQYAFRPALTEFSDRDFLAVAPNGTVYLSWDYSPDAAIDSVGCSSAGSCYFLAGDYNILVVHSSDGGANWSNPVPVDPEYPNGGCPAGPLLVEPNGTIAVLYEDYSIGANHVLGLGHNFFSRSVNGGGSWSLPVRVDNASFPNSSWWIDGALARDNSGSLYATFDTINGSVDTAGVAISRDDGASWSATTTLNGDVNTAAHIEVGVAGGENGTAYVAWMANNSTSGWSTFEETFSGNGTRLGAPTRVSDGFGLNGYWVGDTIGVTYLGLGRVAVSWSYALPSSGTPNVEVYEAVIGETLPGPPTILGANPGAGNATVFWASPSSGGVVQGYTVTWGVEGRHTNFTNVSGGTHRALLDGLQAFVRYQAEVAGVNTAGTGPFSPPINLTLTAWGELRGSISPPTARVTLDGLPVAVSAGSYGVNSTPGAHVLAATESTVVPQIVPVTLPWNGTIYLNLSLALLPGTVTGRIAPSSASVTWDGNPISLGPGGSYTESGAAGSRHTLSASATGFVPLSANVTVQSNATEWLNLTLVRVNVTLELYVTPATAEVAINGTAVVLSADGRANLSRAPGIYRITASAAGYVPFVENVTLTTGTQPIAVTMTPVSAASNPTGGSGNGFPAWGWIALVAVLVGVVLVALIGLRVRGRPPGPSDPPDGIYTNADGAREVSAPSEGGAGTPHLVDEPEGAPTFVGDPPGGI